MKNILAIIFFALVVSSSVYAQNNSEPYLTKSLSKETINNVFARTSGGNIMVSGVGGSDARIEVYITSNNNNKFLSKEEIKRKLDEDYEFKVEVSDGKLTASAE